MTEVSRDSNFAAADSRDKSLFVTASRDSCFFIVLLSFYCSSAVACRRIRQQQFHVTRHLFERVHVAKVRALKFHVTRGLSLKVSRDKSFT